MHPHIYYNGVIHQTQFYCDYCGTYTCYKQHISSWFLYGIMHCVWLFSRVYIILSHLFSNLTSNFISPFWCNLKFVQTLPYLQRIKILTIWLLCYKCPYTINGSRLYALKHTYYPSCLTVPLRTLDHVFSSLQS